MKFLFAWRYFKSKKRTNAVNIISWISITAIGVGAAALIIVLSVFNGFEDLVKGLYGDFYADAKITAIKIAANAVTTAKIADLAIETSKIADSAVTTAKINNGNVTAGKLATDSVTTIKIADNIYFVF